MVEHIVDLIYILLCLFNVLDPQLQATLPPPLQSTPPLVCLLQPFPSCFSRCTGCEPKEGDNCVGLSKNKVQNGVLVGTSAYIGPAPHLDVIPWQIFFTNQSPSSIHHR